MSATIWKYPLDLKTEQKLSLPRDAQVLSVQAQENVITLWALVNPNVAATRKTIYMFTDGQKLDAAGQLLYLGTVQTGEFVWHVFMD